MFGLNQVTAILHRTTRQALYMQDNSTLWDCIEAICRNGLQLDGMDLSGLDWSYAEHKGIWLRGADLTNILFVGATMINTCFVGATCRGADFTDCILDDSDFSYADMQGCDVTKIDWTLVRAVGTIFDEPAAP